MTPKERLFRKDNRDPPRGGSSGGEDASSSVMRHNNGRVKIPPTAITKGEKMDNNWKRERGE